MAVLTDLQKKLIDMEMSQQNMSTTMDDLMTRVSRLAQENTSLQKKLIKMETHLDEYERKIDYLEVKADIPNQANNSKNIIVCGLPTENTDIGELFIKITEKIGDKISNDDIISIEKIKHRKVVTNALKNAFILKLKSPELKQSILTNFRRKKSLHLDEIDTSFSNSRIIMLHHLTKFQSKIYKETKNFKNQFNFRFLWCTQNKIFLRYSPDSEVHHIQSLHDLARLERYLSSAEEPMQPDHPQVVSTDR
jgi:hypothetical protein